MTARARERAVRNRESPWTGIPADDYDRHMGPEWADQSAPLSAIFGETYRTMRPASAALLGCATGNGLEHVDTRVSRRVVALDINPAFLAVARSRHASLGRAVRFVRADALARSLRIGRFDLVHGALILEHVDAAALVTRMAAWLAPGGVCSIVVQADERRRPVTPSPFPSIAALAGTMRLIAPADVERLGDRAGLAGVRSWTVTTRGGRSFFIWLGQARARPEGRPGQLPRNGGCP